MIAFIRNSVRMLEIRYLRGVSPGARFARGTFWMFTGTVLLNLLGMVASIVTARLLGREHFGEYGMILSTIGTFSTLTNLGIGMTMTKFVSEWKTQDPRRAGRVIGMLLQVTVLSGIAFSAAIFALVPRLAASTLHAPYLAGLLRLSCLLVLLTTLNTTASGALAGFEAFKKLTQINLLQSLMNFPLMIACVWCFGLTGAIVATVIVNALTLLVTFFSVRRQCRLLHIVPVFSGAWADIAILWRFSFPLLVSSLLTGPAIWYVNTILVRQPGGYGDMGLVNAANHWRAALLVLPAVFSNTAFPILSEEHSRRDRDTEGFKYTVDLTQRISILSVLPVFTVLIFGGDMLMNLYGRNFDAGYAVLLGFVFATGLVAISGCFGAAFSALNKNWISLSFNAVWALLFIGLSRFLIPEKGAIAYALSFAVATVVLFSLSCRYMKRYLFPRTLQNIRVAACYLLAVASLCWFLTPAQRIIAFFPACVISVGLSLYVLGPNMRNRLFLRLKMLVNGTGGKDRKLIDKGEIP